MQERKKLQSSKHLVPPMIQDIILEPEEPNVKSNNVMTMVILFSSKEISYGDITGSFPFKSSRGNQYIYILYDYDSNSILAEPMKTRQAQKHGKICTNVFCAMAMRCLTSSLTTSALRI